MEQAKLAIEEAGGDAQVVTADLRDPSEVQSLVDVAVERTGRLDIMVNNAGLEFPSSIIEGSPEDWRAMLETNVLALLTGCKAAVIAMRKCDAQGHIVNMSSVSAQRRNSGVYGATKHAVNVISASLRDELEEDDIRVTNVLPGATATNFARHFLRRLSIKLSKCQVPSSRLKRAIIIQPTRSMGLQKYEQESLQP